MSSLRHVFYISDRTGLTAENIGEALLNQFGNLEFKRHTHPFVDTPEKAREYYRYCDAPARMPWLRY